MFAGLPAVPALQQAQPLPRPAQPPAPPRRIVRLAAPPPTTSGGRRGARAASDAVAVPLWQQRRAALGAGRQQAPAATPLTMDALLEQLLSWDARGVLRGGAAAASGLQGLEVPVRFARLEQYTQVRWARCAVLCCACLQTPAPPALK